MESINVYKIKDTDLDDYRITKDGQIYSKKTNKFMSSRLCNGYACVKMNNKNYSVHRLVALTFIETNDKTLYVDHINNDKTDNRVENLQWITQKDNIAKVTIDTSHARKVIQTDLNNNFIKEHDSVTDAGTSIGLSRHAISKNCLKINKTCGGFIFSYKDDEKHSHDIIKKRDLKDSKNIKDFPNYIVFSNGKIYNKKNKKFLQPILNASGYAYVSLCKNMIKKNHYIHVIVATAFIDNPENKKQVNHINTIKDDNRLENLEWVTPSENMIHINNFNNNIRKNDDNIIINSNYVSKIDAIKLLIKYCNEFNKCPLVDDIYEEYDNYKIGRFFSQLKVDDIKSTESLLYIELSKYPIIKENFDKYLNDKKKKLTFEQGLEIFTKYMTEFNEPPKPVDMYESYPIGLWYRDKKKEFKSINDIKYIALSKFPSVKIVLDKILLARVNNEI